MPQNIIVPAPSIQVTEKLQHIAESSQEVLASATTVFPLDLFPDTLTIDREQVNITHRTFFLMGATTSIRIQDILNVTAQVGPFFGSIRIATRFFDPDKPYEVRRFWREDALRLQAILQGLMVAAKKEIDPDQVEASELAYEAERLGQPSGGDRP